MQERRTITPHEIEVVYALMDVLERLSDFEQGFIEDVHDKVEAYEEQTFFSERQSDWLAKLERKYLR